MDIKHILSSLLLTILIVVSLVLGISNCIDQWSSEFKVFDNDGIITYKEVKMPYCSMIYNRNTIFALVISCLAIIKCISTFYLRFGIFETQQYLRSRDLRCYISLSVIAMMFITILITFSTVLLVTPDSRIDNGYLVIIFFLCTHILLLLDSVYPWTSERSFGNNNYKQCLYLWSYLILPNLIITGIVFSIVGCIEQYTPDANICSPSGNIKITIPLCMTTILSSGYFFYHIHQRRSFKPIILTILVFCSVATVIISLKILNYPLNQGPLIIYIMLCLHISTYFSIRPKIDPEKIQNYEIDIVSESLSDSMSYVTMT